MSMTANDYLINIIEEGRIIYLNKIIKILNCQRPPSDLNFQAEHFSVHSYVFNAELIHLLSVYLFA